MINVSQIPKIVAERLDRILESHGWTRYEFAQRTGVPYSTVKRISNPKSPTAPQIDNLCTIADYLGLSLDYLCGRSETHSAEYDDELKTLIEKYPYVTPEDRAVIQLILKRYSG